MELILPVREIGKALDYMKAVPNIYGTQIIFVQKKSNYPTGSKLWAQVKISMIPYTNGIALP